MNQNRYLAPVDPLSDRDDGMGVTPDQHQRGYELWRGGIPQSRILDRLGLKPKQWKWLKDKGNASFPSYEHMLTDEIAELRNSGSKAAMAVAQQGPDALEGRIRNANLANTLVTRILGGIAENMAYAASNHQTWESAVPNAKVLNALRTLRQYCDVGIVGDAFQRIYGASATEKGLYPAHDQPQATVGRPMDAVNDDDAQRDQFLPTEQLQQMIDDMRTWSPEQLKAFAGGKGEPSPNK